MEFLMENYCTYCGMAQGERISCCGENHWMTRDEYCDYHNEDPETGEPPERRDAAPDYRTAEQYYADQAHARKRKLLETGE
jgi:hypothetical protein